MNFWLMRPISQNFSFAMVYNNFIIMCFLKTVSLIRCQTICLADTLFIWHFSKKTYGGCFPISTYPIAFLFLVKKLDEKILEQKSKWKKIKSIVSSPGNIIDLLLVKFDCNEQNSRRIYLHIYEMHIKKHQNKEDLNNTFEQCRFHVNVRFHTNYGVYSLKLIGLLYYYKNPEKPWNPYSLDSWTLS